MFKNKSDVSGAMTEDEVRQVSSSVGTELRLSGQWRKAHAVHDSTNNARQGLRLDAIKTHKWTIMACSAMTGMSLQEGLQWVVQDAKSRLFLY